MFRKMPVILLFFIAFIGVVNKWIPYSIKSYLYATSLLIKSAIIFVLPFLIFGLLFKTTLKLANKSSKMILVILLAICASNFISTITSYFIGSFVYQMDLTLTFPEKMKSLEPVFLISIPNVISNSYAMFFGVILGLILGWLKPTWLNYVSEKIDIALNRLLKMILFSVPLFIIGFAIQMFHDQIMFNVIKCYFKIFTIITFSLFVYIGFFYLIVNKFKIKTFLSNLRNMFPAVVTGMASMSSAAALPLTIISVERNSNKSDLAKSIVPATVNIHLIGDCFAIPIFAFAIMKGFGIESPDFSNYFIFAMYFVIAKFSVAAIPGGGIIVMLPILEKYLHFDGAMLSLITALYILFDPVITGANIFGNGAFSLGVCKALNKRLMPRTSAKEA